MSRHAFIAAVALAAAMGLFTSPTVEARKKAAASTLKFDVPLEVIVKFPPLLPQPKKVAAELTVHSSDNRDLVGISGPLILWLTKRVNDSPEIAFYKEVLLQETMDGVIESAKARKRCTYAEVKLALLGRVFERPRLYEALMKICRDDFRNRPITRFTATKVHLSQTPDRTIAMLAPLDFHDSVRRELVRRLRSMIWHTKLGVKGAHERAVKACEQLAARVKQGDMAHLKVCQKAAFLAKRLGFEKMQKELLVIHGQFMDREGRMAMGANVQ